MGWGTLGSIVEGSGGQHSCCYSFTWIYLKCGRGLAHPPNPRDIGSHSSPPHQMVYPPGFKVPPWVTASSFLAGNREAELKPTTFSSLLLFRVFLSFLNPKRYSTFECCLLGLLPNNNNWKITYHICVCVWFIFQIRALIKFLLLVVLEKL